MLIYKVTNIKNNKIYIGQTSKSLLERKSGHERDSIRLNRKTVYFHNALKSYGFDNFKWEVLHRCDNQEELDSFEKYYIQLYESCNKDKGYNLKYGGKAGGIFNEEAKRNLGLSTKRKWDNPEIAAKMRIGLRKGTDTTIARGLLNFTIRICPTCNIEFKCKQWEKKIYCCLKCANIALIDSCKRSMLEAKRINALAYQRYKLEKTDLIYVWIKENNHYLINVKYNNLKFLQYLADYLEVKDIRTVSKILDVTNRKELVNKLILINENICRTGLN